MALRTGDGGSSARLAAVLSLSCGHTKDVEAVEA